MSVLHIETPLIESPVFGERTGRRVWLKMESAQPPGSFKIRGIGAACMAYAKQGARRFISSSGGNAGIAVAYAGKKLGVAVTVVVPESTTARARELIAQHGADLVVHGASWQEANEHAQSMRGSDDAFLHPFDDPLLWPGHATMIDEVARAGVKPDAVVLSVGGGGLLCGVVEGLHRNGWADVPVIAVETAGADSFAQAMRAASRVMLPAITSIATSLGARQVCEAAFEWPRRHPISSVVIGDRAAVAACERFIDDHRVVVEPACGASLALAYDADPALEAFGSVLIIVCGGATATVSQLRQWSASLA